MRYKELSTGDSLKDISRETEELSRDYSGSNKYAISLTETSVTLILVSKFFIGLLRNGTSGNLLESLTLIALFNAILFLFNNFMRIVGLIAIDFKKKPFTSDSLPVVLSEDILLVSVEGSDIYAVTSYSSKFTMDMEVVTEATIKKLSKGTKGEIQFAKNQILGFEDKSVETIYFTPKGERTVKVTDYLLQFLLKD